MESKNDWRKKLARGILLFIFILAVLIEILSIFPIIFNFSWGLLYNAGFSVTESDYWGFHNFLENIQPYLSVIIISGFIYIFGRLVRNLTKNTNTAVKEKSNNPIAILLNALLKTVSIILQIFSVLADIIEGITIGILHAFEAIFDFIEKILELDMARLVIGAVFIGLTFVWLYFSFFFMMNYLVLEEYAMIIGFIGSLLGAYLCESCAHGLVTRNSFIDAANYQINNIGVIIAIFIILYLPVSLIIDKHNTFLRIGTFSYLIYGTLVFFFLFEFGRRLRDSIKGEKND